MSPNLEEDHGEVNIILCSIQHRNKMFLVVSLSQVTSARIPKFSLALPFPPLDYFREIQIILEIVLLARNRQVGSELILEYCNDTEDS